MSLPANLGRRILPNETIPEGAEIIVLVRAPTVQTRLDALNEVTFIGGATFIPGDDAGDAPPDGRWQAFELAGDSTRGAQAIEIFAREAGAVVVEVYFGPSFDPRELPGIGPVLRGGERVAESAAGTAESLAEAARAAAQGTAQLAGLLPLLLVGGLVFLVATGKFKVSL